MLDGIKCALMKMIRPAFATKKKSIIAEFKTMSKRQTSKESIYKEYYRKQKQTSNLRHSEELGAQVVSKKLEENFTKERINKEKFTKHILDTDYKTIDGYTKKELEEERNNNPWLEYFDKEIIKAAAMLNNKSAETGHFYNNSYSLLKDNGYHKDLKEMSEIMDRAISAKAMTDESWTFVNDIKGTRTLSDSIDILNKMEEKSKEIFKQNPEYQTRGFLKEYYDNINFDPQWIEGVLPSVSFNAKVGKKIDIPEHIKNGSTKQREEWARRNNVKITRNEARKIASRKWKIENGLSFDPVKIITKTYSSIEHKTNSIKIIEDLRKDLSKSELFSTDQKKGFVKIDNPSTKQMLRGTNINYVNEELEQLLMGRKQATFVNESSKVWKKKIDKVFREITTISKQNKVLHNLSSAKNLLLMGATVSMQAGVNPFTKLSKNIISIPRQWNEMKKLEESILLAEARGKNTAQIKTRIEKIPLYQAKQNGLIVSNTDGTGGHARYLDTTISKMWESTAVGNESSLFNKARKVTRVATANILMHPNSKVGENAQYLFSALDSVGRYSIYEKELSKGTEKKEAARIANAYFADMEHVSPRIIELMDSYPIVPFTKWFTESLPGTLKLFKDNPVKAISLTVILYGISHENNVNDSGYNQAESILDFGGSLISTPMDDSHKIIGDHKAAEWQRAIAPVLLPAAYYKVIFKAAHKENMTVEDYLKTVFPEYPSKKWEKLFGRDIRGTTQTLTESLGITDEI